LALLAVLAMVIAACGGDGETTTTGDGGGDTTTTGDGGGDTTTTGAGGEGAAADAEFALFGAPTGVEGDAITGFINVYNEEVGSNITYTGIAEFEEQLRIQVDGGNPPAVAFTPQPASICAYADEGNLASLEDMGFDIAAMEANHSKYWMDLGVCEDGNHYGIPWFPNFKSIVFYHEPTFTANGYEIPETYEDMVALSEQIVGRHRDGPERTGSKTSMSVSRVRRSTPSGTTTRSRSTTRRWRRRSTRWVRSCSVRASCSAAPLERRVPSSRTPLGRCSTTRIRVV
jgi:alpha-glucoside transport system substrate-binding protein